MSLYDSNPYWRLGGQVLFLRAFLALKNDFPLSRTICHLTGLKPKAF